MGTKPLIIAARYKLLLLAPFAVMLPVAIVFALMSRTTEYSSSSTVWVEQSKFLSASTGCSPYITLAQCQATLLNELMNTDDFAGEVAAGAGLPVGTLEERGASMWIVRKGMSAFATGQHPIVLSHTSGDPELSQRIVVALAAQFQARYRETTAQDAQQAQEFYELRLAPDREALTQARNGLAEYVAESPGSVLNNDVGFQQRQADVEGAEDQVKETLNNIDQVKLELGLQEEGLSRTFRIVDPATLPDTPLAQSRKDLLVFPIAGLLLALSLSAGLYTFLLRTDNSIRTAEDLRGLPGLSLLGTVPDVGYARRRGWPRHFFRLAVTALGTSERK